MIDRSYRLAAGGVGAGAPQSRPVPGRRGSRPCSRDLGASVVVQSGGCGGRHKCKPHFGRRDSTLTKLWQNSLFQENFGNPAFAVSPELDIGMGFYQSRAVTAVLVAGVVASACTTATQAAQGTAESARQPYTTADVHFMSAMIAHHAQAIDIARWAPTHGASSSLQILAERVINAQQDEIALMQTWLRDRRLPVPEPKPMAAAGTGEHQHSCRGC